MKKFQKLQVLFLMAVLIGMPLTAWAKAKKAVSEATPSPSPVPTAAPTSASYIRSGFSVGVGWPYVGAKYFFNNDLGAEARFATGEGINVYALRGYWSFIRSGNFSLLTGAEFGYITFDTMNSANNLKVTGDGFEAAPLVGLDYFFDRQFSVLMDFTMPIIDVSSHQVSLGDVEWVFEGGLYFYPF